MSFLWVNLFSSAGRVLSVFVIMAAVRTSAVFLMETF